MRQLQIRNGVALSERVGNGIPIQPDNTWTFVDVTDRPEAQAGMVYDSATDKFSPAPAPVVDPDDLPLTPREQRVFMRVVQRQINKIP